MSVVIINALEVPEGGGAEVERRFAARQHAVDGAPGFEGFSLLRPVAGESRYFVVTTWASRGDFEAWRDSGDAAAAHGRGGSGGTGGGAGAGAAHGHGGVAAAHERGEANAHGERPVTTGASLLEFEVVDLGS